MSGEWCCRLLGCEQREVVDRLWKSKGSIFKAPIDADYERKLAVRLDQFLDPNEKHFSLFGAFEGDELFATWGIYRWKLGPIYTLTDLVINNPARSRERYLNVINTLLGHIFPRMEDEQRFHFYIIALLRPYQLRALRSGKNWPIPRELTVFDRYDVSVETIVPSNTEPAPMYWELMGRRTWRQNLWVRRGSLKPEFLIPKLLTRLDQQ